MEKKRYDVTVIGTALIDCVIKGFVEEPISKTGYHADSLTLNPGGEAFNQAVVASRLGASVRILCGLADDPAAKMILKVMEEAGVDVSNVMLRNDPPTPVTTMFVREDGNRKSITGDAHIFNIHPERVLEPLLEDTSAISLGSLFRAPFNEPEVISQVVGAAKQRGLTVYADTKLPNARKLTLDDIRASLEMVDYITPNEDEAVYYTGETDPERAADVFLEKGVKNVIVKLGARGALFKNAHETIVVPPYRIRAVDATGAGDNFAAGFITARARGMEHAEALEWATACAALCTMSIGAVSGVLGWGQVEEFKQRCIKGDGSF